MSDTLSHLKSNLAKVSPACIPKLRVQELQQIVRVEGLRDMAVHTRCEAGLDVLVIERNGRYDTWTTERYRHRELLTAKRNIDAVLGGNEDAIAGREETKQRNGEELE